jgi:hypothetical protein
MKTSEYFNDEKIIAIDPGKEGGIVVWSKDKGKLLAVQHMPETPRDLLLFLSKFQKNSICYLEKVGGLPGMGGSAMFNFGKGFGHIEMALIARNIPITEVTPQKWQKAMQLGTKGGKSTNEWKTKLKEVAQRIFPKVETEFGLKTKKDWLRVADALLILSYAKNEEK